MLTREKQIVIDKDAFVRTAQEMLCAFVKHHMLLLCDTLWYECATTEKQNPQTLTAKCRQVVEEGGYVCSGNHVAFLQWEGKHCGSYPGCLADLDATTAVRKGEVRCNEMVDSPEAKETVRSRSAIASRLLVEPSRDLKEIVDFEHLDTVSVLRRFQGDRADRLRAFMECVDRSDIHETGLKTVPNEWIKDATRFCLSSEWMSWHYARIVAVMTLEYYYVRQTGQARDKHAEHDLQDMEYVLLLARADGVVTKDRGLVELARVAFPEKDVFTSLEEVPESYRCD